MNQSVAIRFPDFFLVGALRCGTTTLSRYLTRHPQMGFSRPKEPHCFAKTGCIPGPDPLTPPAAEIVRMTLRPDIQNLSRLLERDLGHWTEQ